MTPQINFLFADKKSSAYTPSEPFKNSKADVMTVEISGTFTNGSFIFEGKTDVNSEEYTPLAAVDLSSYTVARKATKAGIYEIGIEGIQLVRVRIESINGGYATILGRVVLTAGV